MKSVFIVMFLLTVLAIKQSFGQNKNYYDVQKMAFNDRPPMDDYEYIFPWLDGYKKENLICNRISLPTGFERLKTSPKTFEHWLQHLPLKPGNPSVLLYDGTEKWNQNAHCYVMDIERGTKDLQQCADALIRLRAEYLYSNDQKDEIHFNYTNGATTYYEKWRKGLMPVPEGKELNWVNSSKAGEGYEKFKAFLIQVYTRSESISSTGIVLAGRLATSVRKQFILAIPKGKDKVDFLALDWWKA